MITRTTALIGACMAILYNASSGHATIRADPCSLLSASDVSAALDAPVTMAKEGSDATHCHWQQQGKRGTTVVDVHLLVEAAKTYDAAKSRVGMSGKVKQVAVSGLGDDAYYLVSRRDAPLFVKKGTSAFRVAVDGKGWTSEVIQSKEKAFATALLGKL